MSRNRFFEIKSFFNAAYNQSLSEPYMAKVEPLHMIFWMKKNSNLISLMKTLKVMSRWYLGTDVIHISHSFVQSQYGCKSWVLVSATGVPYKIKIYQGRKNQVVMNLWVHVLSKMLFKFVKNQKITTFTSTTSFQAIDWYVNWQPGQLAQWEIIG